MDKHSHLNKILAGIKNNPENKTFNAICREDVDENISGELIKEYELELNEKRLIRLYDESRPGMAQYILTVNGQRFVEGGGYSKYENNWILKDNYVNLKWILGIALIGLIAAAAWSFSRMLG